MNPAVRLLSILTPPYNPALAFSLINADLRRVRNGTGNYKIDCIGTSLTAESEGLRLESWSIKFAQALAAQDADLEFNTDSFAGVANRTTTGQVTTFDPRLTFGAGWEVVEQFSYGGNILSCPNTSTAAMTFTPEKAWNTVEIEYITNPGFGTFTVKNGANTMATVDPRAPGFTLEKNTYTTGGAAAIQALNIARTGTGGGIFILSGRTYDSATKSVLLCNAGSNSSAATGWATNGGLDFYGCLSRITKRAADLLVIALCVNDWNASPTAVWTWDANIRILIEQQLATGGRVMLVGEPQSDPAAYASAATQTEFLRRLMALAKLYRLSYMNVQKRWGSYAEANAAGFMSDQRHASITGGADWGTYAAGLVLA
jgi:hypothetical protein